MNATAGAAARQCPGEAFGVSRYPSRARAGSGARPPNSQAERLEFQP